MVCVTGSRRCRCKHGGWRCCGDCTTEARYSCANEEDGCREVLRWCVKVAGMEATDEEVRWWLAR